MSNSVLSNSVLKLAGIVLSVIIAAGGLLTWVGSIAADNADLKRRISTVEDRAKEDRKATRESIGEVKEHVKVIDQNVQIILQTVRSMEAVQRERARTERR